MISMLDCICRVSLKYRASFNRLKCEFLYEIFEYVGHDIIAGGNLTAQSKYDLVNVWSNPTTGDGMYSYNKFCPMFQL